MDLEEKQNVEQEKQKDELEKQKEDEIEKQKDDVVEGIKIYYKFILLINNICIS